MSYRTYLDQIEEAKEDLKQKFEDMIKDLLAEIFGLAPTIEEGQIKNPTRPNMEIIDKYFKVKRWIR